MSIKNLKPTLGGKFNQGYFNPKNPDKYGGVRPIIFRSGWELKFMNWCDMHPSVICWGSEPKAIPYVSPIDQREHQYWVDFFIVVQKGAVRERWLIEIKPSSQVNPPDKKLLEGNRTLPKMKRYNWQLRTFLVNRAKFDAAKRYAAARGWRFGVCDEHFLF